MKKHNDGYALPFVLVVMLVLAIVATTVMSAALQNLQTQQRTIERMQDKYAAQGAIEMLVAQLSEEFDRVEYEGDVEVAVNAAIDAEIKEFCNTYNGAPIEGLEDEPSQGGDTGTNKKNGGPLEYTFVVESTKAKVKITSELVMTVKYEYEEPVIKNGVVEEKGIIDIIPTKIEYKSYEISNVEPAGTPSIVIPTEPGGGT